MDSYGIICARLRTERSWKFLASILAPLIYYVMSSLSQKISWRVCCKLLKMQISLRWPGVAKRLLTKAQRRRPFVDDRSKDMPLVSCPISCVSFDDDSASSPPCLKLQPNNSGSNSGVTSVYGPRGKLPQWVPVDWSYGPLYLLKARGFVSPTSPLVTPLSSE